MRHFSPITRPQPLSAEVRQGAFLSLLELLLGKLVSQLQDKKAEKETDPA